MKGSLGTGFAFQPEGSVVGMRYNNSACKSVHCSDDGSVHLCRFARVVNLNDAVARVPTFFTDKGYAFVHGDGKNTSW